jgi:hypothetical protein
LIIVVLRFRTVRRWLLEEAGRGDVQVGVDEHLVSFFAGLPLGRAVEQVGNELISPDSVFGDAEHLYLALLLAAAGDRL